MIRRSLLFSVLQRSRWAFIFTFLILFLFNAQSWASHLERPNSIISLPENEHAILVEKKTQTLYVYSYNGNGLVLKEKMSCSTGEAPGVKQQAGDKKTPEGVYFLIDEYEDRYLTPIYGKKAFPTDYPNYIDKKAGKNGSAIWIHGTNKVLKPMDSNGCVAMENGDILQLSKYVNLNSTPVIMVEEITNAENDLPEQQKKISKIVNKWVTALQNGTYHDYLSFYSSVYLPDIQWWHDWMTLREKAATHQVPMELSVGKLGIYRHEAVIVVMFDLYLKINSKDLFLGKRKFFLQNNNGFHKIVGDLYQKKSKSFDKFNKPLIAAMQKNMFPELKKQQTLEMVRQWMAAWSAKDMNKYATYYSQKFYSDKLNKNQWVSRKRALARKYKYINVTGKNFKVNKTGKKAVVVFLQHYKSSGHSTKGMKTLTLVDEGGSWKISQESWKRK